MNIPPEPDNETSATSCIREINSVFSETYFMTPSCVSVESSSHFLHDPKHLPTIDHTTDGLHFPLIPFPDDADFAALKPLQGDIVRPSHLFGASPDDLSSNTLFGDVRDSIGINVDGSFTSHHSAIIAESMHSLHSAILGGAVPSVENLRSIIVADATESIQRLHSVVFASAIDPMENWHSTLLDGITKPMEDLRSTILSGAAAPINSLSSAMLGDTFHTAKNLSSALLAPFSQDIESLSAEFSYSALGQLSSTEAFIDIFRLPHYSASHVFADRSVARHRTDIYAYAGFGRERTAIDPSVLQESLAEQLWTLVHDDHISPKQAYSYYRMIDTEPYRLQRLLTTLPMERNVHGVSRIDGNVVTGGDFIGRDKVTIIAHTVNIYNN